MIREILHFFRHVPEVALLSTRMSQADLFHLLSVRADEAGLARWRARLAEGLTGRVLEIGCGTGLMFPHYPPRLAMVGIEPAHAFLERARRLAPPGAALHAADAERLPYADGSFDAVVVAGVLCSVKSVDRALSEIRRVLKPGGEVRLLEHGKSPRAVPGLFMDLANPLWRLYNRQGCNLNRRPERELAAAGFEIVEDEAFQIWSAGLPAFPSHFLRARPVTDPRHAASVRD